MSNDEFIDLNKFPELKDDYDYIETFDELEKYKGNYFKYLNSKEELRQGGILVNTVKDIYGNYLILLKKEKKKFFKVNFDKNYIFKKKDKNDIFRKLFLKSAGFDVLDFPIKD